MAEFWKEWFPRSYPTADYMRSTRAHQQAGQEKLQAQEEFLQNYLYGPASDLWGQFQGWAKPAVAGAEQAVGSVFSDAWKNLQESYARGKAAEAATKAGGRAPEPTATVAPPVPSTPPAAMPGRGGGLQLQPLPELPKTTTPNFNMPALPEFPQAKGQVSASAYEAAPQASSKEDEVLALLAGLAGGADFSQGIGQGLLRGGAGALQGLTDVRRANRQLEREDKQREAEYKRWLTQVETQADQAAQQRSDRLVEMGYNRDVAQQQAELTKAQFMNQAENQRYQNAMALWQMQMPKVVGDGKYLQTYTPGKDGQGPSVGLQKLGGTFDPKKYNLGLLGAIPPQYAATGIQALQKAQGLEVTGQLDQPTLLMLQNNPQAAAALMSGIESNLFAAYQQGGSQEALQALLAIQSAKGF